MLSISDARERAFQHAIASGRMSDIGMIHSRQAAEGNEACFGRVMQACPRSHCRWHRECMELMAFAPQRRGLGIELSVLGAASTLGGGDSSRPGRFEWRANADSLERVGGGRTSDSVARAVTARDVAAPVAGTP